MIIDENNIFMFSSIEELWKVGTIYTQYGLIC